MKISVAIIVYNGERYLYTQLDSILAQTHKVEEIIVCDDASSDNSKEIIKLNHTFNSQQIEWYKNGSALNLIKSNNL